MSDLINVSICVTDIPKERIKQANNGKKYIDVCVSELRKPDAYENTHCVFMRQSKEEREAKKDRIFIGKGKAVQFKAAPNTPDSVEQMPPTSPDDLPF
ncbi:hypothetical protein [Alistipes sp.]|uniref:hypothetical protein n=1 Tax=Alistipes sp. TaxID=1872444 RepID=UPI003AB5FDF6